MRLKQPRSGDKPGSFRDDLRLSTTEGASYCVMVGVGQEYFVAFALALGFADERAGLVATLPVFVGATLQLLAPWAIGLVGSLRRYMVIASSVQAACFVPLIVGALMGSMPLWMLHAVVALYATINLSQGPAWNTWITTLVPRRVRGQYFGKRSRLLQGGVLLGLATGGLILDRGAADESEPSAFALLFVIACVVRFAGSFMLSRHSEPVRMPPGFQHVSPVALLKRLRTGADARLLVFLLASGMAWQVALPFFTPFVLNHRGETYKTFMLLTAAAIVGRMLVAPTVGRLAQRIGARQLLAIGAVGTAPGALLWWVAADVWQLAAAQLILGMFLAAFEIGAMLMQFETIPERERASVLSTFTALSSLAGFLGSLAGATMLGVLGTDSHAYLLVFVVAGVARLLAAPLLLLVKPGPSDPRPLATQPVRVEPGAGTTEQPTLPAISTPQRDA
ncbi:MAG: MFS transporter [Planctomycetota bacterium]